MLHTETVSGVTLELLKNIQAENLMNRFCLAGDTALALYMGYRKSVDLDLFTPLPFDVQELESMLREKYGLITDFTAKNTIKGNIAGIKIDCITYPYEYLKPPCMIENIRLYSLEDITAMKLAAIAHNGSRLKDFIDISCLSRHFSFSAMLEYYEKKFPESNIIRPLKALTYFEDIDFEENIVMLTGEYRWDKIKERLIEMVTRQEKIFKSYPIVQPTKRKKII